MSIRYLYILIALVFLTQTAPAQQKITGIIRNQLTKEPLSGATIYISDLKIGYSSDKNGQFEITNVKAGTYFLEVSQFGFNTFVNQYVIDRDTILHFELTPSHKELTEIVITGVSRSTEIKKNPVIIKSLDKNYLNQNTATNLIDAMKNVPGISQISTGASISKPVIRGLGFNRVISLLNGIKQEGQQWGDEHGIEMDEYHIDKIEIIKGPGSLMYGSDGIAGVLHFLSPKSPTMGKIKTQVISNYQTNNQLIGYSISNAGNIKGFQWLGRFSNKYASNYENQYDGKVLNSGFKEYNGNLFLGLNKRWGHTHLHFNSYNATINLPEGERDSAGHFVYENKDGKITTATEEDLMGYQTGYPHQVVNHLRVSSNNFFILKKGTINVDLGFQNNKRKEYGSIANPYDIDLYFDLNTFNYNARYNFEKRSGFETSIGIGGMQQSHTNRGEEYLIPNYQLMDMGAFIFSQKTFKSNWTVAGGLRIDNRSISADKLILDSLGKATSVEDSSTIIKFNSIKQTYFAYSGSIGLSYQASKTQTIKFNVSRGFRAPNIAELSSNGRHEGTFKYELGNSNLNPEISHQIDFAYFLNSEHIVFELTPFVNFISNYIYTTKLTDSFGYTIILNPNDPLPTFQFTQGNATLWGGEIYIDIHPHPFDWLHFANSFAYVQATQTDANAVSQYLPFIPAPKFRSELKADFKSLGKSISQVFFKIGLDHYLNQNQIYGADNTETSTPSYTLLGIGIGGNIKAFDKKDFMSLFINVENLTDVAYQNHLSRLKYAPINFATNRMGIYNQGRNISLKLILNL